MSKTKAHAKQMNKDEVIVGINPETMMVVAISCNEIKARIMMAEMGLDVLTVSHVKASRLYYNEVCIGWEF
jgi:hypothetical protein